MQKEVIIQKLKEQGCRITKQRLLLLDIILEEDCSCTKEIYYKASKQNAGIGFATVYRMINTLEDIGAISRKSIRRTEEECECCYNKIDYHEIIECIVCALDAKDPYTAGHSQRVSDMTIKICRLMKLEKQDAEKIHIAAHLHDIGKIGVPDAVLNKVEKLNAKDWECIKKHPSVGAEILSKSEHLNELKNIVLCHHERYDGTGYPNGLKGEEIPIGSRIIAICDSIDAMTSDRCYRKAYGFEYCYDEIEKGLGTMYDPKIGRLVLDNWNQIIEILKGKRT